MDISVRDIFLAYLPYIINCVVSFMIALWVKAKEKWSWPVIFVIFLVISATTLTIYNNLPIDWSIKSYEIERNLQKWAYQGNFSIKDNPQTYARFQFIMKDEKGKPVYVINKKEDSPLEITIATLLKPTKNQQKRFLNKSKKWQSEFLNNLNIELIKLGAGYTLSQPELKEIKIINEFYYDKNTSKVEFLKNVMLVRRAQYLTIMLISQALGND